MDDQEEFLISYCNLKSGLFNYQRNFLDKKKLNLFYDNEDMGFPICLPANIKYFNYNKANFFKINVNEFSKKIFNTCDLNYTGNKKFFRYGNLFASNVYLKSKYLNKYNFYKKNILKIRKEVSKIKNNYKNVCAMQIRNVPHFGHEAVFKFILKKFDIVVLNPIFGIKKKNDFSDKEISKALKYMEEKYPRIKFIPIWSNFHYAGPREAIHHMFLRENLNFDYFYVGRDHAGSQNIYKPNMASNLVNKNKDKFKIKSITSKGGYFCRDCKKYLIKGNCKHKNLLNISGTEFRKFLSEKRVYIHADSKVQKIIHR